MGSWIYHMWGQTKGSFLEKQGTSLQLFLYSDSTAGSSCHLPHQWRTRWWPPTPLSLEPFPSFEEHKNLLIFHMLLSFSFFLTSVHLSDICLRLLLYPMTRPLIAIGPNLAVGDSLPFKRKFPFLIL